MSSFWTSYLTLDELINKATSELRPSSDIDLPSTIDIADYIRGKKVTPKEASKTFRKRLNHSNPNVVLLALQVCEFCVQNAGRSFVSEVASSELLQLIQKIAVEKTDDCATKARELLQTWAIASEKEPKWANFTTVYDEVKSSVCFPPAPTNITSLYFESSGVPEYTESSVCERCRAPFSLTTRKHHCRQCGGTFCALCSSRKMRLPHLGIHEPTRVCDGCYPENIVKLIQGSPRTSNGTLSRPGSTKSDKSFKSTKSAKSTKSTKSTIKDSDDDDLQRALRLSMAEANQASSKANDSGGVESEKQSDETDDNVSKSPLPVSSSLITNGNQIAPVDNDGVEPKVGHMDEQVAQICTDLESRLSIGLARQDVLELRYKLDQTQTQLHQDLERISDKHHAVISLHDRIQRAMQMYDRLLEARIRVLHKAGVGDKYDTPRGLNIYSMYDDLFADASAPDFSMANQAISDVRARAGNEENHMDLQFVPPPVQLYHRIPGTPVGQSSAKVPDRQVNLDMPLIDLSD